MALSIFAFSDITKGTRERPLLRAFTGTHTCPVKCGGCDGICKYINKVNPIGLSSVVATGYMSNRSVVDDVDILLTPEAYLVAFTMLADIKRCCERGAGLSFLETCGFCTSIRNTQYREKHAFILRVNMPLSKYNEAMIKAGWPHAGDYLATYIDNVNFLRSAIADRSLARAVLFVTPADKRFISEVSLKEIEESLHIKATHQWYLRQLDPKYEDPTGENSYSLDEIKQLAGGIGIGVMDASYTIITQPPKEEEEQTTEQEGEKNGTQ